MPFETSELGALAHDFAAAPAKVAAGVRTIAAKIGHDVLAGAEQNLIANGSVDTGNLLNSGSVDIDDTGFTAGFGAYYAGFVENGTEGPYIIPNAFGRGGYVEHPGNSPKPYLGPAFDQHTRGIDTLLAGLGARSLL